MSANVLENKLEQLAIEMEQDKNTVRNKAFDGMSEMLMRRSEEIQEVLGRKAKVKWLTLFKGACRGMHIHCQKIADANVSAKKTLENKVAVYGEVVTSIVATANLRYDNIPLKDIFSACLEALQEGEELIKIFGETFFQLLERNIFKESTPLKNIVRKEWEKLVNALFGLYGNANVPGYLMQKALLNVVEVGVRNFEVSYS